MAVAMLRKHDRVHFRYKPMTCNNQSSKNTEERFLAQQEHRQISRLWKRAIDNLSSSGFDLDDNVEDFDDGTGGPTPCVAEGDKIKVPSEALQKKLLKGKAVPKVKSPLQKFDEIVTRELTARRLSEEGKGMPSFDPPKQWSNLQFTGLPDFGLSRVTVDNKVSRGALHNVEKEVREFDPSDPKGMALMDAIEKLAQAQAYCRFDAAVKAAEAATASVPAEMAEEVAMACTKDYQSEIVDVINEKIPLSEERKPIEVIGYIGVTKLKDSA